ncbi:MAG: fatty acid desaturase [Snowella sp.]|nr:fatty acid desaturase [Snowella sp.]
MVQLYSASLESEQLDFILDTNSIVNQGIIVAFVIFTLWIISLIIFLCSNITQTSFPLSFLALLWQTFLYTGLFITSHDAMHGAVYPKNPQLNHWIGKIAVFIFGFFSYQKLFKKHWLHHRYPGTSKDPDYYDQANQNFFIWYWNFMKSYGTWRQLMGFILIFNILHYVFQFSALNLIFFWAIPPLLSSFQLFYFGTFLPHRKLKEKSTGQHPIRTLKFPLFWSFLSCYHFGYHHEHHEFPNVPWWQLPLVYQKNRKAL